MPDQPEDTARNISGTNCIASVDKLSVKSSLRMRAVLNTNVFEELLKLSNSSRMYMLPANIPALNAMSA